ncbi:hypothetical protein [Halochromatium roseum]|uniref:hypothetical protein n=1 Tax=Halochromatium roseum TaxID=391920 RepID=UPI001913E2D1|nr:hypothetical protein [Halochromatium roseum]
MANFASRRHDLARRLELDQGSSGDLVPVNEVSGSTSPREQINGSMLSMLWALGSIGLWLQEQNPVSLRCLGPF